MRDIKTVYEIRLENTRRLIQECGKPARFAEKIDREPTLVSRYAGKNPRRPIGSELARHIEKCFSLAEGWLDTYHGKTAMSDKPKNPRLETHIAPVNEPLTFSALDNRLLMIHSVYGAQQYALNSIGISVMLQPGHSAKVGIHHTDGETYQSLYLVESDFLRLQDFFRALGYPVPDIPVFMPPTRDSDDE